MNEGQSLITVFELLLFVTAVSHFRLLLLLMVVLETLHNVSLYLFYALFFLLKKHWDG